MLKTLNVSDLQPGMLVSKVVSQHGPVKIRKIGMIRSPEMIKGLSEMGVTEVEVDLSQSLGLQIDPIDSPVTAAVEETVEPVAKLTPTQQLLKNERKTAKANSDTPAQYHRSLFMPSMDTLPSPWHLYGKNIAILLLLVVGGVCVGWNVASIPTWLSLSEEKDYVVIEYQPNVIQADRRSKSAIPQRDNENAQQSVNDGLNEQGSAPKPSQQDNQSSEIAVVNSEPEAEPLVLGYQPENAGLPSNTDLRQTDVIAEASSNSTTNPALSAALLEKINKAIADLDNEDISEPSARQANNYDDLPRVDQLSVAIQTQIPAMAFSAHMYSSNRDDRWVRVNGRRLVEGDYIAENLQLVNIEPQKVILSFDGEVFTMNALSDW